MRADARALVWGAGGFTGGELLRLLATHPRFQLAGALSETYQGKLLRDVNPGLSSLAGVRFISARDWDWDAMKEGDWTLFVCLPHRKTMSALPPVLERLEGSDLKVVDLSGDFRLEDPVTYERYYGEVHQSPRYLGEFVYGLPELNRSRIAAARRVANPGCFATGAQLAILPMAAAAIPIRCLAIDGKTGSSGAGTRPLPTTHHPRRSNNFRAYSMNGHQHVPEIQGGWLRAGGAPETEISFVPHMAPLVRGIFTTAHFFFDRELPAAEIQARYEEYYSSAPFVRTVQESPEVVQVWGSNRCDLSVTVVERRAVVCTAIDNLVKGASGQAIQNANLMNGWPEAAGLTTPVPWPV